RSARRRARTKRLNRPATITHLQQLKRQQKTSFRVEDMSASRGPGSPTRGGRCVLNPSARTPFPAHCLTASYHPRKNRTSPLFFLVRFMAATQKPAMFAALANRGERI